jgi:hypothetical protein
MIGGKNLSGGKRRALLRLDSKTLHRRLNPIIADIQR